MITSTPEEAATACLRTGKDVALQILQDVFTDAQANDWEAPETSSALQSALRAEEMAPTLSVLFSRVFLTLCATTDEELTRLSTAVEGVVL
jgi:hypothetical protein